MWVNQQQDPGDATFFHFLTKPLASDKRSPQPPRWLLGWKSTSRTESKCIPGTFFCLSACPLSLNLNKKNYKLPVVFMFLFGFIFINYIFFCSAVIHWSFSKNLTLLESVSLKQEKIIPKKVHHIYWKTCEGFFIFKTKNSCSSYHVSTNIRTFFVLFCRDEIETCCNKRNLFFCKLISETLEAKVFECLSVAALFLFCFAKRKKV